MTRATTSAGWAIMLRARIKSGVPRWVVDEGGQSTEMGVRSLDLNGVGGDETYWALQSE
ncbi:hypothetical protein PGTUg99_023858 [Puccinia graminis f. sp. tritici]|uniref:Uncharacterized protein n=1 Tax=Puccinia graminis f. sp. tritici TaxID=56615 RepID=A0A5B0NEZ0_PUCGR|nr:hypothetical protein PGTUg99_023858 [Puccinia graminis f. sp. tritici]